MSRPEARKSKSSTRLPTKSAGELRGATVPKHRPNKAAEYFRQVARDYEYQAQICKSPSKAEWMLAMAERLRARAAELEMTKQ
jgi:hypothetical protein